MDFFGFMEKLQASSQAGMEDVADQLSFFYSVILILLSATVVTAKQYMMSPISCYIPTEPSGSQYEEYVTNLCWVQGTIPLLESEAMPTTDKEWADMNKTRKINYYQWVPFVLALQCILFYIPRAFWQLFCYNRTGTDLEHLVTTAVKAVNSDSEERDKLVTHIVRTLEDMLFQHRDYRRGRLADMRRSIFKMCAFCVVSKRLGTWLVCTYVFTKLLYLANCIGQIWLMKEFLGFNSSMTHFGWQVAGHILNGSEWESTLYFPRVAFCHVDKVRHLGAQNTFTAQCVLPVNMLSEKIYIFLWFWTVFVAIITAWSLPLWLIRMGFQRNRHTFVKKFLMMSDDFSKHDKPIMNKFIREFLRHDGIFLLRMISLNAGDIVTCRVVMQLWELYKKKYRHRDLREDPCDNDFNMSLQLERGGTCATTFRRQPSAPAEDYV